MYNKYGEIASQKKGCPKNVFLSLCQEGHLKNVPIGKYTKSIKNKEYALKVIEILKSNHSTDNISILWKQVNSGTTHNSQIDVVLALFKNNFIN